MAADAYTTDKIYTAHELECAIDAAVLAALNVADTYKHQPADPASIFAAFDDPDAGRKVAALNAAQEAVREVLDTSWRTPASSI